MSEQSGEPPSAAPWVPDHEWVADPVEGFEPLHSWESQAVQYAASGPPGVSYVAGEVPGALPVNCLLWRDDDGTLRGILNHYPQDYPLQQRGTLNLWVQPGHFRRGIATALVLEARRRWPDLDRRDQTYTDAGARFANAHLQRHPRETPHTPK